MKCGEDKRIKCKICGDNKFFLLLDVYSKDLIQKPHFEAVCSNCNFGVVILRKDIQFKSNP